MYVLILALSVGLGDPSFARLVVDHVTGSGRVAVAPAQYVTDIATSERVSSAVGNAIKSTLVEGARARDWERVASGLSPRLTARFPSASAGTAVPDARLDIRRYDPSASESVDGAGLIRLLGEHTDSWVEVERAGWHVFHFLLAPDQRRAYLESHFQLAGQEPSGARTLLELTVAATVESSASGSWRIRALEVLEGHRVRAERPAFRDITDAVGFHFNRSEENQALRQTVIDTAANLTYFGLSVVDWNDDGLWDLLATEALNQSVLFLNDGRGGLTRAPLPLDDPHTQSPSLLLHVDLDGDGREELVSNQLQIDGKGSKAWLGLWTAPRGRWRSVPRALAFELRGPRPTDLNGLTAGDIDGDGDLDLFAGVYETVDSRDPDRFNLTDGRDGGDNLLFVNEGGLRFIEVSDERGVTGTRYTFAAGFFDFDADGDVDLYEVNDYGHNVLFDNDGTGRFTALVDHPLGRDRNYSMSLSIADPDTDPGTGWSVYIANMYSHAGHRVVGLFDPALSDDYATLERLAAGNQMFREDADGAWQDAARTAQVYEGGWSWGSVFYDLDNDGDRDLFVANGNTSHRDARAPDY